MKEERPTREIYEIRGQGKNKIERPGRRLEDQMRQKAEKGRIQWNEARRLVQDRNSWKRKIREIS
jgi:hypothetical protein